MYFLESVSTYSGALLNATLCELTIINISIYQTTLPASWETCMQVRKQQLELDMEQQTGST